MGDWVIVDGGAVRLAKIIAVLDAYTYSNQPDGTSIQTRQGLTIRTADSRVYHFPGSLDDFFDAVGESHG